jgi:hypothetical protein
LAERLNGIEEVVSSNLIGSTIGAFFGRRVSRRAPAALIDYFSASSPQTVISSPEIFFT